MTRLNFYTIIIILNLAFILLPNICIHDNENKMKNNSKMDKKSMTSTTSIKDFFALDRLSCRGNTALFKCGRV